MTETITVPLVPDEDGYVGRECPNCERYFKVRPGTGLSDQEEAYCPYCAEAADASDYLTREQRRFAISIARAQLQEQLLAPLQNLGRSAGPLGLKITITADDVPVEHYQEAALETSITCERCTLEYKVYGVFATCPDCGTHNSRAILQANIVVLRAQLEGADERVLEDILKNSVASFDAFGRALTEHATGTKISFQNLDGAETNLQGHGHSLRAHATREEWEFLVRCFQKRHVLAHNMGVIDEQYMKRANDREAIVGRKVRLTADEVERTLDLLDRLSQSITIVVAPPEPLPTPPRRLKNPY